MAHLPEALLPERRKRRSYISGQLFQHEVNSKNPYGKKLFLRLNHGQYILNLGLKIRQGDVWCAVYELQSPEDLCHDLQSYLQDMSPELVEMLGGKKDFYERSEESVGYWVGVIRRAVQKV